MAKYSVGQKVKVVDNDNIYNTYYNWVTDNKISLTDSKTRRLWSKYLSNCNDNDCENDTELTVVVVGYHKTDECTMYLCEDSDGNPVLVDEEGLDSLVENTSKLKWADLKIGDILKNKMHGYTNMITGVDRSVITSTHVQVGGYWITDDELSGCWEKVEE